MNLFVVKKYEKTVREILSENENIYICEANKQTAFIKKIKIKLSAIKNRFTARRGMGGMMGAGVPDNFEIYKNIGTSIVVLVANGIAWDVIKTSLKKIYSVFKTRKKRYIEIIDEFCEPGSCHIVKFLIPVNLSQEHLDEVLNEAETITDSFKKIRFYFHSKQIIFKYKKIGK